MTDQMPLHIHSWYDEECSKEVVLLLHGMAEHGYRYNEFAEYLVDKGYQVIAPDHRGHGETGYEANALGYFAKEKGWNKVIEDIQEVTRWIHEENPDKEIIIMGHSMGSILARTTIQQHGQHYKGAIICGSTLGGNKLKLKMGGLLTSMHIKIKGENTPAVLLDKISFGGFNNKFKPNKTSFDWLNRDVKEVEKYIEDPYCGYVSSGELFKDLLYGNEITGSQKNINKIPKSMPILLIAGDKDPVGNFGKEILQLETMFKKADLQVTTKLYEGARHEILNETNKKAVYEDIYHWLDSKVTDS